MIRAAAIAAIMAATGSATAAQTLEGRAAVLDGDTLELGGERVRLHGIDAPELRQTCLYLETPIPCGAMAAEALSYAVSARRVVCHGIERDRYGRLVALCRVGQGDRSVDLGWWMVRHGAAVAERRYGGERYANAEARAKSERAGLWSTEFQRPSDYRRANQ